MRAVARLGEARFPLYGRDAWEASRIDSFLDVSLVFARDSQIGSEMTRCATSQRFPRCLHVFYSLQCRRADWRPGSIKSGHHDAHIGSFRSRFI
jgi:hypothetical protein